MAEDPKLWQCLRVGDLVRLTRLPKDFFVWSKLHRETREAYRYLLNRRSPVRVVEVDEYGYPWIEFRFRDRTGKMGYHWLMINHGGIARVKRRKKARHPPTKRI